MQDDLKKLEDWTSRWLLKFNDEKCKTMHFGYSNPRYSYELNSNKLEPTSEEKDLGVIISDNLQPSVQCAKAANRAMSAFGIVKKCFKHLDQESFPILYKSYVRPQRQATKLIPSLKHLPYEERLRKLNLMPLVQRRLRGDLIETFKFMKRNK